MLDWRRTMAEQLFSLAASAPSEAGSAVPDSPYADVLAEIRRLQEGRTGWASAILILLVSLALFTGASAAGGQASSRFESLGILVPVLLFHEAGHYAAMRAFGYRNLRVFFIPFFGAAVSGRHYNVAGWKKAVVSLMGPVPGIFAGAILGVLGLFLDWPVLVNVGLMAVLVNGFNLLPVLPLDGGRVMNDVLFSRHYLLEGLFRVGAVLSLAGLSYWGGDPVLAFLAVLMAISLPLSFRLARAASDLRGAGLALTSPDDQTIPDDTAHAIILKLAPPLLRTPVSNTRLAEQVLQVFETLNARPPGLLVTLALLFVLVTSLLVSIVLAFVLVAGRSQVNA